MGKYFIPNATFTAECATHITADPTKHYRWTAQTGGVLFVCDELLDTDCATLYSGFTPAGTSDEAIVEVLPPAIQNAVADFKQFMPTANGTITNTQRDALLKDLIRVVNFLNNRITNS